MLGNSLASLSLDDSDLGGKKKAEKGVFDEIDQEIANIQAVKAKYKKEAKEYKEERRKRVVADGSAHNNAHSSAHSNMYSTSSIGSNASSHSHASSHGTSRDLAAVVTKAISLQSIKEAVSDIYEAEEGILNEKVNSVGARFVTNVLASLKQRKVKRPSHQTS